MTNPNWDDSPLALSSRPYDIAMASYRVSIACPQGIVPVDRTLMREVVRRVLSGEDISEAEISLAFVDNPTIHRLNQRYMNHDEPTDVMSFPLSEPGAGRLSGELVIGAEVAQAEAFSRGHDVKAELTLYVIHGLLHLCGYDDKIAAEAQQMRKRQRHYLRLLRLPDIAPKN